MSFRADWTRARADLARARADWTRARAGRARAARAIRLRAAVLAALLATALAAGTKPPPSAPVDINTATVAQLKTLPGAGDSMAAAIVHYREKNGPFRRVEELLIIKGISKKRLASWKPYLREVK